MQTKISSDLIQSALSHIPANLPRDDWAKVLAAVKSEFDNDEGFSLAEDWSKTADSYSATSFRDTWKSIKASGGVTIGTLFYLAQQNGFVLPSPDKEATPPDPESTARLASERAAKQKADEVKKQAAHDHAASEAALLWQVASESAPDQKTYLDRKQVQGYGVRFAPDGWLLVPLVDTKGALWNLQRINPAKPTKGSDKLFLPGGRVSGLLHWCGDPVGAAVLLVCEGYATGASLHECTGRPCAVAFNAGNLHHVAKALRTEYPAALIVVCGDDDRQTFAEKGFNPGRDKATAAARVVGGIAVFPDNLPEGGNDFNDLHQARGYDPVAEIVNQAIDFYEPPEAHQTTPQSTQTKQPGNPPGKSKSRKGNSTNRADGEDIQSNKDRFEVSERGVFYWGIDANGNAKGAEWICGKLHVEARTRDQDGTAWGYYLSFADPLHIIKKWALPARMLSGDGSEYRATLLNMGLHISTSSSARNRLTEYIQTRYPAEFTSCTDRIGWHGTAFVLPRETIGTTNEQIVFQSDSAIENTFRSKGDASQWRERIGTLCVGNSRMVFGVSCAFAAPLLRPAGMESGGIHFNGDSSSGKTTILKLAASVNGGANYLQRWRATDNALEATAAQHSDCLLILDELAQVDPKVAGECCYMLANETGKARASRTGAPRPRQTWRLLFLSAGELGLSAHMAEGMKRSRTGQEVRMVDIPADAGAGLGAFEKLHGFEGGAAFAKHLTNEAQIVYGATGRAWLQWLTDHADSLKQTIRNASNTLASSMIPKDSSGQVERVGGRFALIGAAGELATAAGLTGWPVGESERAARVCFDAWLASRGGNGNGEIMAMLRQVRRFLEQHGEGRFSMWHRSNDDHAPKTLQRAGVRRMLNLKGEPIKPANNSFNQYGELAPDPVGDGISFEYFIFSESFKTEVCQGIDYKYCARVLLEHGCLKPDKGRPYDCKPRIPGVGNSWCYCVTPAIFELLLN